MFRFLSRALAYSPVRLLAVVWSVTVVHVFAGPVDYGDVLSFETAAYVIACLWCFAAGHYTALSVTAYAHRKPELSVARINRLICIAAWIGILGSLLVVYDKLWLSGIDYSAGLWNVRLEMASARSFLYEDRSLWLWIGTLCYSATNAAVCLAILAMRHVKIVNLVHTAVATVGMVGIAALYGGRSMAILMMLLAFGAYMVTSGHSPRAKRFRLFPVLLMSLLVVGIVFYSLYVFRARAAAHVSSAVKAQVFVQERLGAKLRPPVRNVLERRDEVANIAGDLVMASVYFTHSIAELDYLLRKDVDAGPYWGLYQFWLANKALRAAGWTDADITQRHREEIDRRGLFFTAWGGMYLDFGIIGSLVGVGLMGMCSGWLVGKVRLTRSVGASIILAFMYWYVLMTPIHALFPLSNVVVTLFWIVLFGMLLWNYSLPHSQTSSGSTGRKRPILPAL